MTDTLTIEQAARRLGVNRDTAKAWLRQHTTLQPMAYDRGAKGLQTIMTYTVPVSAVEALEAGIKAWEENPDHITAKEAATILELTFRHVDYLIATGKLTVVNPPEGLPKSHAAKYPKRISRASVLAYKNRSNGNEP